jgi:hypothetical protein
VAVDVFMELKNGKTFRKKRKQRKKSASNSWQAKVRRNISFGLFFLFTMTILTLNRRGTIETSFLIRSFFLTDCKKTFQAFFNQSKIDSMK